MGDRISIKNSVFCIVDLETTGINAKTDMIIEVGIVKVSNFKIVDKFHQIVDPLRKIPSKVTEITGITNDIIQGMPTICDITNEVINFINNCVWVEHSRNWFDYNFRGCFMFV